VNQRGEKRCHQTDPLKHEGGGHREWGEEGTGISEREYETIDVKMEARTSGKNGGGERGQAIRSQPKVCWDKKGRYAYKEITANLGEGGGKLGSGEGNKRVKALIK